MKKEAKTFLNAVATYATGARNVLALFLLAAAPYRQDHYRAPVPDTLAGATVIQVDALQTLITTTHPILIDVLPAPAPPADIRPGLPRMPVPHLDIPGSYWLAEVGRGTLPPPTEIWFRNRLAELTKGDTARPMVFYCLSQCWMSWNAAKRAVAYGYKNVIWFPEGADGWQATGHNVVPARTELPPAY